MLTPHFKLVMPVLLLLSVLLFLTMAGCAQPLQPTPPVVVKPPRIPSPPQVNAPLASGLYWQQHCKLMQSTQALLKPMAMASEPC